MIKKKSNAQNIIIIILCILLVISIAFGVTYSYYNGKTDLIKGTITTANLSIELHDDKGITSEFSISAPIDEMYMVPGNNLNNLELNIYNKCRTNTYMVVLYALEAYKVDTKEDVTSKLQNTPAISFQDNAIDSNVWKHINYPCKNKSASYTCLVGINEFKYDSNYPNGKPINVLSPNSIKIPTEWGNDLKNCNVTISVRAYAIQSDLEGAYLDAILAAEVIGDKTAKAHAIANAVLEICGVDVKA